MATTKSSVLGFRIDHDRREWVETEAARQGITIRSLFEGFIDQARAGEKVATGGAHPDRDPTPSSAALNGGAEAGTSARLGLGSTASVPGGLVRGAVSLVANVLALGGRCARTTLRSCPVSRTWFGRPEQKG